MAQTKRSRAKPGRGPQATAQRGDHDQNQSGATGADQPRAAGAGQVTAPFWEKVVGAIGLVLVLAMLGFLVYQALDPQNPPDIAVELHEVSRLGQGFLVQIRATNSGDLAAASVVVEAMLSDPNAAPGDPPVESGEVTFDFVPAGSMRQGAIIFRHDPAGYVLDFQVKSFVDP